MRFDPQALLKILKDHGVRFLVIGGVANTLHGSPYPTEDLDVCPSTDAENLGRLVEALTDMQAKEWDPHKDKSIRRNWSVEMLEVDQTWHLVTSFGRLDLLFLPAGTKGFSDLQKRKIRYTIDRMKVDVAHLEDIIRMKETAGRQVDRMQLPTLRKLLERRGDRPSSRS